MDTLYYSRVAIEVTPKLPLLPSPIRECIDIISVNLNMVLISVGHSSKHVDQFYEFL